MLKHLAILLALSSLAACGGGRGSSDSALEPTRAHSSAASTTTPAPTTTPSSTQVEPETVAAPEVTRTADLVASETFDFTSSYDVSVNVNLGPGANRYLNICNDFLRNGDQADINYGSCVLQTPLENGEYRGTMSLTNDIRDLAIAIWDYTGGEPTYYFWNLDANGFAVSVVE